MSTLAPESYLKPDVIRQVQRFDLKAKFLVEGFLSGLHASPYKGFSVEFSEHRKYAAGDDVRSIDWKVWSRTNRYYVKQYEAETNMTGHLVMDVSGSMGYASKEGALTKLEYATYLAGAMAYLMIQQQDPVGLITAGAKVDAFLKAKSKPSHLLAILRTLSEATPYGETSLAQNLHQVAEMIPHRGLVMVFSDLLDDEEKILDAFSHLRYRGHDVIVFQIFDEAEANFTFDEMTRFEDIEGGKEHVTAEPAAIKAAYLSEVRAFLSRFRSECHKRRVDFVSIDTSTSFDKALMAYLSRRCGR